MSVFVLAEVGFNPVELFTQAEREGGGAESTFSLAPGTFLDTPLDTLSLGLALVLGTAGLPHILMRFFTVPDAKAARSSVGYAVVIIGIFYILTTFIGFGARAILGQGGVEAAGKGGNLAAPNLAQELGGGAGTAGGDIFLAIIAAVAFATILAVVAGLVLSASGAVAHDIWSNIIRQGRDSEHEEVWVARIAAGRHRRHRDHRRGDRRLRPERLVQGRPGLRGGRERELPGAAARAELAAFNTTGAVAGVLVGVISSIGLVIVSPGVWPGPDSEGGLFSFWTLANPGLVSIPLGFAACVVGTFIGEAVEGRRNPGCAGALVS